VTYVGKEDALRLQDDSLFITMTVIQEVFKTQELDGTHLLRVFPHNRDHQLTRLQQQTRHMSEYKHVLANILHSRYVARMPPLEAHSRSNVENASSACRPAGRLHCRHIAGWPQACN